MAAPSPVELCDGVGSVGEWHVDRHVSLHFRVPYMTVWGQSLVVSGDGRALGDWDPLAGARMSCKHVGEELVWEAHVSVPFVDSLRYRYVVINEDPGVVAMEMGVRSVMLHPALHHEALVALWDDWQLGGHQEKMFASSAFTEAIFSGKRLTEEPLGEVVRVLPEPGLVVVQFTVCSHRVEKGQTPVLTGSCAELGNWQPHLAVELTRTEADTWQLEIATPVDAMPITYKYAVRAKGDPGAPLKLEHGECRMACICTGDNPAAEPTPAVVARHDFMLNHPEQWKGGGVAVPVFSLRSQRSVGVGEFRDVKALVDLCEAAGLHMAQLLPINDTSVYMTYWDSYPYCALSVFALHPLYLCLEELSSDIPESLQAEIDKARKELDKVDVDYTGTMAAKRKIAREIFDMEGEPQLQTAEFKTFFENNKGWLQPYAAFCFLRDLFGTSEHWTWGRLAHPDTDTLERLTAPGTEYHASIQFSYYLQYNLHLQLLDASHYAASKGVALKGDLPIGVDKRSVDTWLYPNLFRMDVSTGAPPDMFDKNGQNWGFPTYAWEEMAKDDYTWWRARLTHMAQYFHAYRIDHILGFFRIWEIPGECLTATLGHFRPSIPLWRHELESRGLWDMDRLIKPYVRHHIIEELFGSLAVEVACKYFTERGDGLLEFREQYASERAILGIQPRPGSPAWLVEEVDMTRRGLITLLKNVLLLENPMEPGTFLPRFGMEDTISWRHLDAHAQEALRDLSEDYFHRRQDALWSANAMRTLPALMNATRMLVFGEDLGFVPACVPPVLHDLGLFGLRIQRMSAEKGDEFGDPAQYPYMTVASPSCHDVSTVRGWYEEDEERRGRFWTAALGRSGPAPAVCTPAIIRDVVRQHMEAASCWVVFPLQDILALSPKYMTRPAAEEMINDPTNPKHYWRYRMHVLLEDVADDIGLMTDLRSMLVASGRCDEC